MDTFGFYKQTFAPLPKAVGDEARKVGSLGSQGPVNLEI